MFLNSDLDRWKFNCFTLVSTLSKYGGQIELFPLFFLNEIPLVALTCSFALFVCVACICAAMHMHVCVHNIHNTHDHRLRLLQQFEQALSRWFKYKNSVDEIMLHVFRVY